VSRAIAVKVFFVYVTERDCTRHASPDESGRFQGGVVVPFLGKVRNLLRSQNVTAGISFFSPDSLALSCICAPQPPRPTGVTWCSTRCSFPAQLAGKPEPTRKNSRRSFGNLFKIAQFSPSLTGHNYSFQREIGQLMLGIYVRVRTKKAGCELGMHTIRTENGF
jgi:hypothetical protein